MVKSEWRGTVFIFSPFTMNSLLLKLQREMNRPAPLLVIVNNAAARTRLAWPGIRETLTRSGVAFRVHETRGPGDAQERTRAALRDGYTTIAATGR